MLLSDLEKLFKVTDQLIDTFGAKKSFKKEYAEIRLEIHRLICEEFDVEKITHLPSFYTNLLPKSEFAAKELKKWIADNYQFPEE